MAAFPALVDPAATLDRLRQRLRRWEGA